MPRNDLAADLGSTPQAANARTGYDLGFRVRFFLQPKLALAPAFHFSKFRTLQTEIAPGEPLSVSTSILAYSLDLQYYLRGRQRGLGPFLTIGMALARNRYEEKYEEDVGREASVNAPVLKVGAGLRLGAFEFSFEYRFDRFETIRFVQTDAVVDYNWDNIVARVGWVFPTR